MRSTNGRSEAANLFLTYCKAIGVLVAATSGVAGMVISIVTSYREPTENLAKQSYRVVQDTLKKVSSDLQKEHDANAYQHSLIEKDISAIRGEMKLVVRLLESGRNHWTTKPARVLKDLQTKIKRAPAVESSAKPQPRPPVRVLPSISNVQQQARTVFKGGDS